MSNILEYTLILQDLMSAKLHKIGVNSDSAIKIFSELEKQQLAVKKVMNDMGASVGTLSEKLRLLRAEKEWIPAGNDCHINAIFATSICLINPPDYKSGWSCLNRFCLYRE